MKRIVLGTLAAIVLVLLAGTGFVWARSTMALHATWQVHEAPLSLPADAGSLTRGQRHAITYGCTDCHGADLGGRVVMEQPPVGRMAAPNITRGTGGIVAAFTVDDWERAIRHGIKPDGHGMLFMPTRDYAGLTDADTAELIAYLRQVPVVDRASVPSYIGPVGRGLFAFGKLPMIEARLIDQHARHQALLTAAPTVAYGRYLAQGCTGCHGEHFSGGAIPGLPPGFPKAANLTPDASGLARWSRADFHRALRQGRKPDGRPIDPFMPWKAMSHLNDTELDALWAYLHSVPPRPAGQR